ncbi:Protein of unknown function [Sulfitobacter marinus]|uniref:DUF2796 domain-containing protein n=1 Tax=Sulfitobacter marinus TaxID=394264 RepID=A0A1I6QYU9_9RHOB|nr:DUF2796 domain-containing protein [Sulfitobacter marinus]SFS57649.1 Protein of unknown function [Sulfitobacter marinus]
MKQALSLITLVAALPALADHARQLDAHEHGVGTLDIAIEGTTVALSFEAPGADIVGFEYAATSEADLAAIAQAVKTLGAPLDLFVMPDAAGCAVVDAKAELEGGDAHGEHEEHGDEHHDDHAEESHDDHGHDDHGHDDHGHKDDSHDGHDDHGHDDHAEDAGHTEFHATYTLTCDTPDALTEINFAYFQTFPNAQEIDVQLISASGARAFEVERSTPLLDLER